MIEEDNGNDFDKDDGWWLMKIIVKVVDVKVLSRLMMLKVDVVDEDDFYKNYNEGWWLEKGQMVSKSLPIISKHFDHKKISKGRYTWFLEYIFW